MSGESALQSPQIYDHNGLTLLQCFAHNQGEWNYLFAQPTPCRNPSIALLIDEKLQLRPYQLLIIYNLLSHISSH